MYKFLLSTIFFIFNISFVYSTNYTDFSYLWNKNYERFILNYVRDISGDFFGGGSYEYCQNERFNISLIKLNAGFIYNTYIFSFKPFYSFKKDDTYTYGAKIGVNIISEKENITRSLILNLATIFRDGKLKYSDTIAESQIEFGFDKHIFLSVRGSYNLNFQRNMSSFDYSSISGYNYLGSLNHTFYSDIGVGYGRSFKPDFNSYIYFSFNIINTSIDNINSYLLGFKAYLDDDEKYFMDFGYNYADFKKYSNEKVYRISLGMVF